MTVIASAVPGIIDALVAQCSDWMPDDVDVLDAQTPTGDTGDFLMVGADDPTLDNPAMAAATVQVPATMGTPRMRTEEGDVYMIASAWNGDSDGTGTKSARDRVYAIASGVATMCRQNPFLEVDSVPAVPELAAYNQGLQFGANTQLVQAQDDAGASAYLMFSVHFTARL